MLIKAIATDEGLNLIKDDVKNNVLKFCLFGFQTATDSTLEELIANEKVSYETLSQFKIYENNIHSCYYDENGFLTFELEIDYLVDLQKYIYGVALINEKIASEEDANGVLQNIIKRTIVSLSNSGKIFKSSGVGGLYIYKVNVTGNKAEIIYQNNDYINLETAQMMDRDTLNNAKQFADNQDTINLQTAKTYADDKDTETLNNAKEYVDEKTNATDTELANHANNQSNPHAVTKAQIGLGNVDNTADSSKRVSYAESSKYSLQNLKHPFTNFSILPPIDYPPNATHTAVREGYIYTLTPGSGLYTIMIDGGTISSRSYVGGSWSDSGLYPVRAGDSFGTFGAPAPVIRFIYAI